MMKIVRYKASIFVIWGHLLQTLTISTFPLGEGQFQSAAFVIARRSDTRIKVDWDYAKWIQVFVSKGENKGHLISD